MHFSIIINSSTPTRRSISSYNTAGFICEVCKEVATQIAKNCPSSTTHSHLMPHQEEPPRISAFTLYFQKLESLAYIFIAASIGLSLFKFVQWAPKDAFFVQHSAFWQFKVIQGRWFWYQSKARTRLHICLPLWLWSYIAPFLRYVDLYWPKIAHFLLLSHSASPLSAFPWEFHGKVNRQETRVMGLSYSEDRNAMIVAWVVLTWYHTRLWRTDRRSESIIANTALCIASYADAL